MKEREISIVDLLVEILLRWRMFIIWMVIGAVLLEVFSYTHSLNAAGQQELQPEVGQALRENLSEEELGNVDFVIDYEMVYLSIIAYEEELVLMQLDPNKISKAEATVAIESGESLRSYDIEKVYEDIIVSGELLEKVAEETDMETADIYELLFLNGERLGSFLKKREELDTFNISVIRNDETKCIATFNILVVHSDEAESKKILEAVLAFLEEKKPEVEKAIGKHELMVANKSLATVADMRIAQEQIAALNELMVMRENLAKANENLSETEKQYYDYLISEESTDGQMPAQVTTPSTSKKYAFLGAIMAAFFYAFVLLLRYIFNTKIRITDNLQELYDVPQLGMIPAEKRRKKFLGVVDEWILSIRNRNKRQFTLEEALQLASVAVKMAAGKEELHEICLVGCGLKEKPLDVCEKIKACLDKENIQVNILNNVLYDAQMMKELEKAKGVVLIGSAGATLYDEIVKELELLRRQEIKVLGGILVE